MAVLRWDPWGQLAALQRDVNDLFGRTGGQLESAVRGQGLMGRGLVPAVDSFRTEDGLVVRVELPGMSPDDVDVSVQDGVLTISGERRIDEDVSEDQWVRRERAVGRFERSFSLPEGVDADQIKASFDNGVLELRVPNPPETKPHRVPISGGGGGKEAIDVGERQQGSQGS